LLVGIPRGIALRVTKVDQSRSKFILSRAEKMAKSDKAAPQTPQQRQSAFKARQIADGYVEMSVWVKAKTNERLLQYAVEFKIGKGEVIDDLVSKLP
tara:strand:- start:76 stop:366 length:291 start_codon:yes stop_codon:yes gene_type:complete